MSTDQLVTIGAVLLGILIVIRLILRVIRSHMEYKQIQSTLNRFMKNNGYQDEHRDKRS